MLLNWETHEIIATAFSKARTHDFKLFNHSCIHVHPHTMVLNDLGYLSLERLHAHSFLPAKASKPHPMTCEEKCANRTLARFRLYVENVIGRRNRFRILAERYRDRRKRFGLRFNLIAGIYNVEFTLSS